MSEIAMYEIEAARSSLNQILDEIAIQYLRTDEIVKSQKKVELTISEMALESWQISETAGWHQRDTSPYERLALIHSEVSEALETLREGRKDYVEIDGKPEGFGIELADIIIRVGDLAIAMDVPLSHCIRIKMEYNRRRKDVPARGGTKEI